MVVPCRQNTLFPLACQYLISKVGVTPCSSPHVLPKQPKTHQVCRDHASMVPVDAALRFMNNPG